MKRLICLLLITGCAHDPLARFKELTGGARWDAVNFIESKGTIEAGGLSGPYRSVEDVRDGRKLADYRLGPLDHLDGFDGEHAWYRSTNGEVTVVDGDEEVKIAHTSAWLTARGYWRDGGASYSIPVERERDGKRYLIVAARPEKGVPIELGFDERGLLVETRYQEGQDTIIDTISDYRDAGGVQIAFSEHVDSGDPRNLVKVVLTDARVVEQATDAFTAPEPDRTKVAFVGGAKQSEIPFQLANNHIYVNATIDGQPVRLLVDTGG